MIDNTLHPTIYQQWSARGHGRVLCGQMPSDAGVTLPAPAERHWGCRVKISHADSAEETFSTLMGDLVEPRPTSFKPTPSESPIWTSRQPGYRRRGEESSPRATTSALCFS